MSIEVIKERSKIGCNQEEVVIVLHRFRRISRYAEEGSSGDQLIDKTSETPDFKGPVDLSSKNKPRRPEASWSDGLGRWLIKR